MGAIRKPRFLDGDVAKAMDGFFNQLIELSGSRHIQVSAQVDVNERIKEQLETNPVLVYIKGTPDFPQCGFSGQTVAALKAIGRPFAYVNIFEDPEIREGLKTYSNWPTFPQLYVDGELVGGCDIVVEMYHSGELQKLLSESGASNDEA
jgi:monothiol glutaredoxin